MSENVLDFFNSIPASKLTTPELRLAMWKVMSENRNKVSLGTIKRAFAMYKSLETMVEQRWLIDKEILQKRNS